MASEKYYGTGRRKTSVARVYLVPGTGKITINKRDIDEYLGLETLKLTVRQPLVATATSDKFDVNVNVCGGGIAGQAGAIRHGISRALLEVDSDEYRPILKKAGFLTREGFLLDGAGVAEEKVPDEPVAEEVVVDSAEYQKIVDKYTEMKNCGK